MKEAKSDILNLSNSKNLSLPKSFQKIKKSKNLQIKNNKKIIKLLNILILIKKFIFNIYILFLLYLETNKIKILNAFN